MTVAVLAIIALAPSAPWLCRRGRAGALLLVAVPTVAAVYFATFLPRIADGRSISHSLPWAPALDISLAFFLDGLSVLFALLITGIGALVLLYAGSYVSDPTARGRLFMLLLVFMGSMLGLVLADNLITLYVFWELTSISSYLLIGFDHERREARAAALQALLITSAGGLALLGGLVLLGQAAGTLQLSALAAQGDLLREHHLYTPILLLILAGAFTKSAQFPFHFWLPGAMAAPTPVSAYLHSATMVKAGVYLLARLSPVLGGTDLWEILVTTAGAVTMLAGGVVALYQSDLKRILAYSTVSALGTLVMLLGVGSEEAVIAAMVFLLAHALYKGALFMLAGAIDHASGTRDASLLGGLRRAMPLTALAALLAGLSLTGFGPVLSFIAKELMLEAALHGEGVALLLVPAVTLAGAVFVALAGITALRPFIGPLRPTPHHPHETPPGMLLGPALLALLGLLFGLAPVLVERGLITPASMAVLQNRPDVSFALWHGFTPALALSVSSVAIGVGLAFGWTRLRRATTWAEAIGTWSPARVYSAALTGLLWLARVQTRLLQNGFLRHYLIATIGTAAALGMLALVRGNAIHVPDTWPDVQFYQLGLAVLLLAAALAAAISSSRLAAVASLSLVGYGIALIYINFGAPDLAMTQVLIETLTVILFVLVFYHMPSLRTLSNGLGRARDAAVAIAAGSFITLLVLAATAGRAESKLAPYFAEQSRPLGHGRNIVNVIIVDFRALDTLGEITVLSIAAFGVFALLRLRLPDEAARQAKSADQTPPAPGSTPPDGPATAHQTSPAPGRLGADGAPRQPPSQRVRRVPRSDGERS